MKKSKSYRLVQDEDKSLRKFNFGEVKSQRMETDLGLTIETEKIIEQRERKRFEFALEQRDKDNFHFPFWEDES